MIQPSDTLVSSFSVQQAFPGSVLEMPAEAVAGIAAAPAAAPWWWHTLILLSVITVLACIPSIRFIGVRLLDCIWRWRGNYILEASIPNQNSRNFLAVALTLPFCMMVSRFGLAAFKWLAGYLLLRELMYHALSGTVSRHRSDYRQGRICFFNYYIILVILMLSTLAVMSIFSGASDDSIRGVLLSEAAVIYLLHFVRKAQILRSVFPALQVFLYLCGLEIVPSGLFLTATVLL